MAGGGCYQLVRHTAVEKFEMFKEAVETRHFETRPVTLSNCAWMGAPVNAVRISWTLRIMNGSKIAARITLWWSQYSNHNRQVKIARLFTLYWFHTPNKKRKLMDDLHSREGELSVRGYKRISNAHWSLFYELIYPFFLNGALDYSRS